MTTATTATTAAPHKLKISYYDFPGRNFAPIAACKYAGVPLEVEGITFQQWYANDEIKGDRTRFPLGDMPVLEVTAKAGEAPHVLCESVVIYGYIGQLTGLWPNPSATPFEAALVHEAFATYELIWQGNPWDKEDFNLNDTFAMEEAAKKAARQGPVKRRLAFYMRRINDIVAKFSPTALNMFDLVVAQTILDIRKGGLDFVDSDFMEGLTALEQRLALVQGDAKMAAIFKEVLAPEA